MLRYQRSIYSQQVLNRKVTTSVENVFFSPLMLFFFHKWTPRNTTHERPHDCHNDRRVTKMKNCISGESLRYIWSFFHPFFPFSPLFPLSSLTFHSSVFSLFLTFSLSSLAPFLWLPRSCPHPLSCYPVHLSSFLALLFSSPVPLSFPFPAIFPACFVPVCQKSASVTGCCCITVPIMQIYLLFNISKVLFCKGQNKSTLGFIHEQWATHIFNS